MLVKCLKMLFLIAFLTGYTPALFCGDLSTLNDVPVSYQGRYRPAAAYTKLRFIPQNHEPSLTSALRLHFSDDHPSKKANSATEYAIEEQAKQLTLNHASPQQIELQIENSFPLAERLQQADTEWLTLPSFADRSRWYPLKALKLRTYDTKSQQFVPVSNFTAYSDETFDVIRDAYLQLEKAVNSGSDQGEADRLGSLLIKAYTGLISQQFLHQNSFPSLTKLKAENFYYNFPFTPLTIACYSLAALLFILYRYHPSKHLLAGAWATHTGAFFIQSCCLALRCYILSRPPVSNMFETLLFVPWIAVLTSYLLYLFIRTQIGLIASALASSILLSLMYWSRLDHSLENVQPVLDSHYWLIIHVLMVVGSYGIFVLGGLLGHLYLLYSYFQGTQSRHLEVIGKLIIQSMFLGTALLIPGTILGGVWAAQSWGRFWDWDPKESWAFISSCTYLIWIHAFVFKKIHYYGAAIGSIVGLIMIGFTWYGVNYILGTGMHSYGFGQGGAVYFLSYLIAELFFLVFFSRARYNKRPSTEK